MSKLLDNLNDEELDFTVTVTDTSGLTADYEFLDIVNFKDNEYAVLLPLESADDGMVEIFRIIPLDNGDENYEPVTDDAMLDEIFEIFRIKNEDEFDFD